MMTEFTFGVVTYNSESTIVETLESIKYQIEHYGGGIRFYLIVSDDCSTDSTLYVVNEWIRCNKEFFFETKVLSTPINSGLCVNYAQMINAIKTDFFIEIAGDDLISSANVLQSMSDLRQNEIRIYLPILYDGEHTSITETNIARQLFYKEYGHSNKKDIHLLETLNPYSSPEVTFLRQHYSTESMEFIKQYRNFEDDTSLYYILRNNRKVEFVFKMEPFIIYRKSGESMTSSVDNSNQIRFLDDLYKFRKYTLKNEKNVFIKVFLIFVVWDAFLMKHRFDASRSINRKLRKMVEQKRANVGMKMESYIKYKELLDTYLRNEEKYLRDLKEKNSHFLKQQNLKQ